MRAKSAFLIAVVSLLAALPAFAHHSFAAEFDENKPIAVEGVVSKIDWSNPHVYVYIDVKDAKGTVTNWGIESQSVGELLHHGWTRGALKVGDTLKAEGFVAKDGSHLIGARLVTFGNGQKVFTGSPGDGGPGDPTAK